MGQNAQAKLEQRVLILALARDDVGLLVWVIWQVAGIATRTAHSHF